MAKHRTPSQKKPKKKSVPTQFRKVAIKATQKKKNKKK